MDVRHKTQVSLIEHYIREGPYRATIVASTGFGKSKIAIDILKHKLPKKVLLMVNSTDLRDTSWRDEFEKFNFLEYYENNVETVTYQLAYKWKSEDKDLTDYFIVADEIDFAADVPELSKFFYEFPTNPILGLTGFITESKKDWFTRHLPVFTVLTADQAQEDNILNNIHFVFVKYDLSKNPNDVTIKYFKDGVQKTFTQSENSAYDYKHAEYVKWIARKEIATKAMINDEISYEEYTKEINTCGYMIEKVTRDRADLLVNSVSSAQMTKKLIAHVQSQNTDDKIIVFSKRVAQSIKICGKENSYNGKLSKDKATKMFNDFKSGDLKLLGVCDKLNRGVNIDRLTVGIFESFFGSNTKAVQRFGRLMRLHPDEMATVYILLPHFMRKTSRTNKVTGEKEEIYVNSPTQQVTWASNMIRSTKIKSSTVWDYRAVKDD